MAVFSGRGRVIIQELDMSDRVPSFPGVYAAMVMDVTRGTPLEPMLITSETNFLKRCTVNETIAIGDDLAFYEAVAFLQKSNKLWVIPPEKGQLHGGVVFGQDKPFNTHECTVDVASSCLSLIHVQAADKEKAKVIWDTMSTGDFIRLSIPVGGKFPLPLSSEVNYYIIKYDESSYRFRLARSKEDASMGNFVEFTAAGTGNITINFGADGQVSEILYGFRDPATYLLDTSDGKPAGFTSTFVVDLNEDAINVEKKFYDAVVSGDVLVITGEAKDIPGVELGADLTTGQDVYAIKMPFENEAYKIKICRLKADVANDNYINFSTLGGETFGLKFKNKIINTTAVIDGLTDAITVDPKFYLMCETGDQVQFTHKDSYTLPDVEGDELDELTTYYVVKGVDNKIQLKREFLEGAPVINFTSNVTVDTAPTIKISNKIEETQCLLDMSKDVLSVDETFWEEVNTGYAVKIRSDGTLPAGLSDSMTYYVIKLEEPKLIKLASNQTRALNGISVDIRDAGELDSVMGQFHHIDDVHNTTLFGFEQNSLLVYTRTPNEEDLYVTLMHYPYGDSSIWSEDEIAVANDVKEPNAFLLNVYKKYPSGETTLVESWTMSRYLDAKDGNGQTLYCEDVADRSFYIRVVDNKSVNPSIYPTNQISLKKLTGAYNGHTVTTGDMITALDVMRNRRRYSCLLILDGGYTVPAYQKAIISVCEARQWTFGILCTPIAVEQSAMYAEDIVKYRRGELSANTSHAALYSPHIKIYDKYNDREIFVGNSGMIAAKYAETAETYEIWYAVAGNRRGILNDALGLSVYFTEGDLDYLQDNGINPIEFHETKGFRIWGASTLLSRASALDSITTRMLLCYIEPAIDEFLDNFIWDINDAITRNQVVNGLNPYMEGIKSRRGVYDYLVKCDSENNTNEDIDNYIMHADVFVQPTKYAKWIPCKIVITKTGATMSLGA